MTQPFRLRYASTIVGLLTLAILVGIVLVAGFVFRAQNYFDKPEVFYLEVTQEDVRDLYEGAEVWMLGRRIGQVSGLEYVGQGADVRLELAIHGDDADQVTDDVEIRLERKFGLGTPILRIQRPSPMSSSTPSLPSPLKRDAVDRQRFGGSNPFVDVTLSGHHRGAGQRKTQASTLTAFVADATTLIADDADDSTIAEPLTTPVVQLNDNPPPEPRRLRGFVTEPDKLQQVADEVAKVAASVQKIEQSLTPTLDSIDRAAGAVRRAADDRVGPAADRFSEASQSVTRTSEAIRPTMLDVIAEVTESTRRMDQNISALTHRIDNLVDGEIREAVTSVQRAADTTRESSSRAALAADKAADAAAAVQDAARRGQEDFSQTLVDVEQTSQSVRQLANDTRVVVKLIQGEAEQLPGTTERINDTVVDTQNLVGEIRDHWLLRNVRRPETGASQVSPTAIRTGMTR